ncbi:SGNH/GDSL hydrolase family protein [Candidatus Sumerlaeota bacterium]|nr:SGNH/GDSL hydrolase family protein [Candidatus Sumerlaeota bacterium]
MAKKKETPIKRSLPTSKKIIFVSLLIVILVIFVELVLRLTGFSYYGLSSHLYSSFVFDRDLKYRMVPGDHILGDMKFHVNKWGYRGRDWEEKKKPGVFRILVIGDSSTFGYGSLDSETYPRVLADILNASGKSVEALNFGMIAYSSWGSVLDYKLRGSKFDPDMLIIFLGNWNDFHPAYRYPDITEKVYFRDYVARGVGVGDYSKPWYTLFKMGQIFLKIKDESIRKAEFKKDQARFANGYYVEDKAEFVRRVPVSEFEENLKFFTDVAKRRDIPAIFIVPKLKPQRAREKPICELYRNKVKNIEQDDKIKLLNLDDIMQNQDADEIWQDDGFHFKPKGNWLIAKGLASIIETSNLIPVEE